MSIIERVAKEIFYQSRSMKGWDDSSESYRDKFRTMARAAIFALREPTEEMVDGADDAFHETLQWYNGYNERSRISPRSYASAPFSEAIWRSMIDSALSPSLLTPAATPTDSANPPPVESVGTNSEAKS